MNSSTQTLVLALLVVLASPARDARAEDVVRLPLATWQKVEEEVAHLRKLAAEQDRAGRVVVGETRYQGRSDGRNLHLSLLLRAQLAASDAPKIVPVVGVDAVLVSAKRRGQPVALSVEGDRWCWKTRERGAVELEVELVVPPRGPRGSIEYRFGVVESPVTELTATFPAADLSPEVAGAVESRVRSVSGGTELHAMLTPTRELHLVGFHDVESRDAREAKLYGETESLVSISEDGVDLFSVVGLTILYAPAKRFRVELPAGWSLVSADGQGAFQYTVEHLEGRDVLVGETAFGIERHYEISLRLRRPLGPSEREVPLPVPKLLDVERDSGFVALEVPGKLSIHAVDGEGLTAIDARELPPALVRSSVSPVVRAFRYAGERRTAKITLARHPEKPLAAGGVDVLRATSVVTADGRVMTDLLFTIRNNLQQYLALELAEGAEVRSAVLDGDPIKPSRDQAGRVLVPLRRSKSGPSGLVPFRVQLVYERTVPALGAAGQRALALPKLLVPVASLDWSVYVPGTYTAAELASPISAQTFVKNAEWHRGGGDDYAPSAAETEDPAAGQVIGEGEVAQAIGDEAAANDEAPTAEAGALPADGDGATGGATAGVAGGARGAGPAAAERASGAMPVRVQLPRDGRLLHEQRYWVDAGEEVTTKLYYLRAPLPLALEGLAVLALGALIALAGLRAASPRGTRGALVPALAAAILAGGVVYLWTAKVALVGALLGAAALLFRTRTPGALWAAVDAAGRRLVAELGARLTAALQSLGASYEARRARGAFVPIAAPAARVAWGAAKLGALVLLGGLLVVELRELVALLGNPL